MNHEPSRQEAMVKARELEDLARDLRYKFEKTAARTQRSAERVNDFATPGVMNLLCGAVDCVRGVSPVVAG
jgi:hypothetical protein